MAELPGENAVAAWVRLVRTQSRLLDQIQTALKAADLPPLAWYDVLLELHHAGSQGMRQYEIGDHILLPKYNLSRLIDRLEREQLVARASCPEDGRGNLVRITGGGERLLRTMWPVYGGVIRRELEERLTAEETDALGAILDKLLK